MQGLKHDARQGALTVGESAGLATAPVGKGLSEMAGFLSHASDNANAIASKVFAGELVLAGVAIVGIIAAVFLATGNRPVAKMLEGRRIRSEAD